MFIRARRPCAAAARRDVLRHAIISKLRLLDAQPGAPPIRLPVSSQIGLYCENMQSMSYYQVLIFEILLFSLRLYLRRYSLLPLDFSSSRLACASPHTHHDACAATAHENE